MSSLNGYRNIVGDSTQTFLGPTGDRKGTFYGHFGGRATVCSLRPPELAPDTAAGLLNRAA